MTEVQAASGPHRRALQLARSWSVRVRVCARACMRVRVHLCVRARACVHVRVRACACACVYVHCMLMPGL